MRRPAVAVFVVVAVLAAGCGGSKTGVGAGSTPSGAAVAPSSALAFASVNTDESSAAWKNADALLQKFPIREKLLAQIQKALADNNLGDARGLLGPELDVVVLDGAGSPQVVALTQPTDTQKFDALLDRQSPPAMHAEVDGWTIFSDKQAALTGFTSAQSKGKLADVDSFKQATDQLPADANAIAYVNGAAAVTALKTAMPQTGSVPSFDFEWLGASLTARPDSVKLYGAVKSKQSVVTTFTPSLLSRVPSGALVVLSFKGSDQLRQQLRDNPAVQGQLGLVQQSLGVSVDQLYALISGEGVIYVRAGALFPEVTVVFDQSSPSAAQATVNKLATRVAGLFGGKVSNAAIPGVSGAKKIDIGAPVAIYYGIVDGALVISDATGAFRGSASSSITADPVFQKASDAAGRPKASAGFVYVNIKDAIPLIEGLAQVAGTTIPPEVSQNLAPLVSFMAYGTAADGVTTFSALLQAR
jgi:hypothetical protein